MMRSQRPAPVRHGVVRHGVVRHGVVPPFLLRRIAEAPARASARGGDLAARARATLELDAAMRAGRVGARPTATAAAGLQRAIHDTHGTQELPGDLVRAEGAATTGDAAADEAYDGLGDTYRLYDEVYGRSSLDGKGLRLDATVHYGQGYDNAFWDGTQMVFGDGDGEVFRRFTISVSVIGHELTHGFTQLTAGLDYQGQSGALNESVSDVFGVLVEQHALGQTAEQATWLVGQGLFTPAVQGRALRDMAAPGTAYDDDVLGRDPQPATMAGYVETTEDNGGVHLNSGIPNKAFQVAATTLGGPAWERAGQVWFDVMTGGTLAADVDFAGFAAATVAAAGERYGARSAEQQAVRAGWGEVGVPVTSKA
ncbi:M4 family metallopeptidase [Rhodococcus aerolatus]